MTVPDSVVQLVEDFNAHLTHYKSNKYNETRLRIEYLNPLFEALGWDVSNKANYAAAYKDVVHEDAIRIGGTTKAPDYCFRIGGVRKFFVEAKKPSIDIKGDIAPAYQLRRYAWSAKLPLSILTDFEEFAVYDTRIKPNQSDKASTARVFYTTFDRLPEVWGEVSSIFSREAILRGAFDQYSGESKRKRGTSEVDDAFLEEIERWRELLAKNFALRNSSLDTRDLNYAVQQTIDRIIFLRICEDRGLEDYGRLRNTLNDESIYAGLCQLFRDADARYNSGLFHFNIETSIKEVPDHLTLTLQLDNKPLKDLLKNLYYPDSPYEFSVLPADILGHVYERFLGSTISLTSGHRAKIEQKPEVRKAGGVFYTPTYIVNSIVENTLGNLLNGSSPDNPKPISISKAAKIKVLDPACGSGSFLIVAYQYLLDWHLAQYCTNSKHHSRGKNPKIYQAASGDHRLTTDERKRILLNNIYGVDIDPQAVEVAKLSLLLKVVEGETEQIVQRDFISDRERILPNLSSNIRCGNSLIGAELYEDEQMLLLDDEDQYRINVFDWQRSFPEVFENGGFDCVIGNPPYIRIQGMKEWAPQEVEWLKQNYEAAGSGNFDIYICFIEKGLSLLSPNGILGYITPNKFFNSKYGALLRNKISAGAHLKQIVHFGFEQVFEQATTYTCLLFLGKTASNKVIVEKVSDLPAWRLGNRRPESVPAAEFQADEWNIMTGQSGRLIRRLIQQNPSLDSLADIFVGVQTSADSIYHFKKGDRLQSESQSVSSQPWIRKLVSGTHVKRYSLDSDKAYIVFPYDQDGSLATETEVKENAPSIWTYLESHRQDLESRERGKFRDSTWYRFGRNQNIARQSTVKLCVPRLVDRLQCAMDVDGSVVMDNVDVNGVVCKHTTPISLHYIAGIINSELMGWLFPHISAPFRGGWYSANKQFLGQLPIRIINFDDEADVSLHDKLVLFVKRMFELTEKLVDTGNPNSRKRLENQIHALDKQIDQLIYELYGLQEGEIQMVSSAMR